MNFNNIISSLLSTYAEALEMERESITGRVRKNRREQRLQIAIEDEEYCIRRVCPYEKGMADSGLVFAQYHNAYKDASCDHDFIAGTDIQKTLDKIYLVEELHGPIEDGFIRRNEVYKRTAVGDILMEADDLEMDTQGVLHMVAGWRHHGTEALMNEWETYLAESGINQEV